MPGFLGHTFKFTSENSSKLHTGTNRAPPAADNDQSKRLFFFFLLLLQAGRVAVQHQGPVGSPDLCSGNDGTNVMLSPGPGHYNQHS